MKKAVAELERRTDIERLRDTYERQYGRVATRDVDTELAGRTPKQQYQAWFELT